jgi:hypothetical protein
VASARELLEQADALMRKNRSRGDGDIPLLTDAVALVPVSLAVAKSAPSAPAAAPPADVPVLTDAVDEAVIEFEPPPEPPAALVAIMEGDPSDWLVMDTVDPESHSITGRAPDTLAVVPAMTLKAAGSQATPPPMGSQPRAEVETSTAIEPDWASLSVPVPEADVALPPVTTLLGPVEHGSAADEVEAAPPSAATVADSPDQLPGTLVSTQAYAEEAQKPVTSLPMAGFAPSAGQEPKIESHSPAGPSTVAIEAPVDRGAGDEERWRALAEQVSMQVLQRLDLFTDTGLKEQLASRLEPIVERASAELVGEITEHVGRLIRTYVSEAIEREIAAWKRDQQ